MACEGLAGKWGRKKILKMLRKNCPRAAFTLKHLLSAAAAPVYELFSWVFPLPQGYSFLTKIRAVLCPLPCPFFALLFCFVEQGLDHIAENILSYLDARSLCAAELVCKEWQRVISEGMLWKKLIERMVRTDPLWKGLSERRGW